MTYAVFLVTVPRWANPCPECQGRGVTGERYEMPTDNGPILICDIICPVCEGCGNGPDHEGCHPDQHAWPEHFGADDYSDYDGRDEDGPVCYSCGTYGRGWNAVDGLTVRYLNEPDDSPFPPVSLTLRVPCGCRVDRLVSGDDPDALVSVVITEDGPDPTNREHEPEPADWDG
jgi:hypothetical protein